MNGASETLRVFLYALLTALATGLGALPFLFIKTFSQHLLGFGNALAAGLMLAASFNLIYEGLAYSMPRTVLGVLLGLLFIVLSRKWLESRDPPGVEQLRGADALQALLIVGVMTLHSFAEGIGVGVAFGGGEGFGTFISLAIAVHNIPEGLAIALVLIPKGVAVWRAGMWAVVSSLPQPLMAVPAFLFVAVFEPLLPVGLGLAAGAMIWMAFSELLPEALEDVSHSSAAVVITLAVAAMTVFQVLIA